MPIPVGTWSVVVFGPAKQPGALSISASGAGTLSLGGGPPLPLTVVWYEGSQSIAFTTPSLVSTTTASFDVYEAAVLPMFGTVPSSLLVGNLQHYNAGDPAGPPQRFGWFAEAAPKPKEKEKEKEKEHKDKDKDKEHKDFEKHPADKLPELQFAPSTVDSTQLAMSQLEQRIAVLEHQFAAGKAFIQPAERPAVGDAALKPPAKDPTKG